MRKFVLSAILALVLYINSFGQTKEPTISETISWLQKKFELYLNDTYYLSRDGFKCPYYGSDDFTDYISWLLPSYIDCDHYNKSVYFERYEITVRYCSIDISVKGKLIDKSDGGREKNFSNTIYIELKDLKQTRRRTNYTGFEFMLNSKEYWIKMDVNGEEDLGSRLDKALFFLKRNCTIAKSPSEPF